MALNRALSLVKYSLQKRTMRVSLVPHVKRRYRAAPRKKTPIHYLLRDGSCQVPSGAVPRHSDASRVHRVLSQHPLLEEVLDHTVHVLIRDGEVVSRGQSVPG
ncbi:hypothetical protein EYF80_009332 [Liparis tanakae]|uniref:Uncharacterized protein n=1 Tax=Liparis tanakae TaxID=230148 RepID=A0A4Z2IRR5_9TELE|nr:hypothetical protein EYF80_009332 [Liparis tanakae]